MPGHQMSTAWAQLGTVGAQTKKGCRSSPLNLVGGYALIRTGDPIIMSDVL